MKHILLAPYYNFWFYPPFTLYCRMAMDLFDWAHLVIVSSIAPFGNVNISRIKYKSTPYGLPTLARTLHEHGRNALLIGRCEASQLLSYGVKNRFKTLIYSPSKLCFIPDILLSPFGGSWAVQNRSWRCRLVDFCLVFHSLSKFATASNNWLEPSQFI